MEQPGLAGAGRYILNVQLSYILGKNLNHGPNHGPNHGAAGSLEEEETPPDESARKSPKT